MNNKDAKISPENKITKALNIILTLMLVIVPVIYTYQTNHWFGILMTVFAIIVALFFVNIDKFERYKVTSNLLSLEAELRKSIDEAYAAVEDLRKLGLAFAQPIISSITMSGQLRKTLNMEYKLELVENLVITLKKLGASEKDIEMVSELFYTSISGMLARDALVSIRPEKWEELDFYKDFPNWDFTKWDKPKIERFAIEHGLTINEDTNERLEDIDYFLKNKKLRRPEKWNPGWQI